MQWTSPGKANRRFSILVGTAESGLPTAQLQLAELLVQNDHGQSDAVSAYMWHLIAETTMASLREQIDEGKKNLALTLTPVSQELAEAEHRAADRLNNLSKQSISEGVCLVPNQTTLTGVP